MAGISNEKKVEASIIPAALLIINENAESRSFFHINTSAAPAAGSAPGNAGARSASGQPEKI